ncbi:GNAT family N-acetyltransferase [Ideonella alba]|uniref:GNAT family N-acetyltransferase n=1 Tax=Ideonella alba TaxID=2824118 RepID=A0A941BCA3_9BURK|nr:GNAT family N-acetyltransferase [Ideonella alba]MBQ0931725.1 GNAT family N-acetyltransferase [Ideonella alba]
MAEPLFASADLAARPLRAAEVPALQALFSTHPFYFRTVNGRDALPDEAQQEFDERPPPHLSWRAQHVLGLFDAAGRLQGTAVITEDLGTPGCCHLGLLWLVDALHGRGIGQRWHAAYEAWARRQGARWLRLGVVQANTRATRFWTQLGYQRLRVREGVDTGGRINTLWAMLKPLGEAGIEDYLARVPRDRPGSNLP